MNDGPHEPEDAGFSLNANGPAYTSRQDRHGVPLNYVSEKLSSAIEELHRFGQQHDSDRDALLPAMCYMLVAHLGLNNMLGKANDRALASRLLNGSSKELHAWLHVVAREGDVHGLATLDDEESGPPPGP
ncbi:MAG: hypothetical protein ABI212_11225 [Burkholderiaceae bacterium]